MIDGQKSVVFSRDVSILHHLPNLLIGGVSEDNIGLWCPFKFPAIITEKEIGQIKLHYVGLHVMWIAWLQRDLG